MLVLTRRRGERIVIGNEIVVEVLGAEEGEVRLGISAPRSVSVHRHEVFAEIEAANRSAANLAAAPAPPPDLLRELAARLRRRAAEQPDAPAHGS